MAVKIFKKSKVFSHIYVLFFVMISFIIFNAQDMGQAFWISKDFLVLMAFRLYQHKHFIVCLVFCDINYSCYRCNTSSAVWHKDGLP